jgi:hypothetical protein
MKDGGFLESDLGTLMEGRHMLSAKPSGLPAESAALRNAGIPGIRYLDQGSRATTGGEVLGTFQKDGKWFSKVRVANRTGVGFNTPTTMITTSAPHESEAAALSWANSKINSGTSNYVVFPGAEDLLKILERNGVAP